MKKRQLKTLKGFNDYLPEDMRLRNYVIDNFVSVYEKYGYEPLETPALEYADTLLGISGDEAEKLMYRFKDKGGRDVIMRYEVMVPMCRVIAQYKNDIIFPFKRYQIQQVWRADKPQKGRLREFTQCDADTIGTSSVTADAEFIQMGIEVLDNFGFKEFEARISNRKFLFGLMEELAIDKKTQYQTCMALDNLGKIGVDGVKDKLSSLKLDLSTIENLLDTINLRLSDQDLIDQYKKQYSNPTLLESLTETQIIIDYLKNSGVDSNKFRFDPSIARGLAHYTGPVWEFDITEGNVGSVAGCGRYDDLIGEYLGTGEIIPATGGSFGIERMMIVLKERNMVDFLRSPVQVLVTLFDDSSFKYSLDAANTLRSNKINTFLYPDPDKIQKQLKFADKKGFPYVIIIGPDEIENRTVTLKNMESGEQSMVTLDQAIEKLTS